MGALAVVALTWVIEHVMPPPYSGYLALVTVALVVTEAIRRQPRQRAERMFRLYCRARESGADEAGARARMLGRLFRRTSTRERVTRPVHEAWTGATERDRVIAGVALLLAREGKALDRAGLGAAWDRARDRFTIPGWELLPAEFVGELRGRLDAEALAQLDALVERYGLFRQRFFRQPSALAAASAASVGDFARLLASLGNRVAKEAPADAERAYRISLRLRPEENLAHAGLALLLEARGRSRQAVEEARLAIEVLDAYARHAGERVATAEDIFPFKSPAALREALHRVAAGA